MSNLFQATCKRLASSKSIPARKLPAQMFVHRFRMNIIVPLFHIHQHSAIRDAQGTCVVCWLKTTPIPVKFDRPGHSCNFFVSERTAVKKVRGKEKIRTLQRRRCRINFFVSPTAVADRKQQFRNQSFKLATCKSNHLTMWQTTPKKKRH